MSFKKSRLQWRIYVALALAGGPQGTGGGGGRSPANHELPNQAWADTNYFI